MQIKVTRDRKSTFEQKAVKKHQKDISDINQKFILMYQTVTCGYENYGIEHGGRLIVLHDDGKTIETKMIIVKQPIYRINLSED